jgi:hypothetical protein
MTSIPEKNEEDEVEKSVPVTAAGRYSTYLRPKTVQLPNPSYSSQIIKTQNSPNNIISNNDNVSNMNISDNSYKKEECIEPVEHVELVETVDKPFHRKIENYST